MASSTNSLDIEPSIFELEILMFFLADIHGQQIKWRASMEVKDMVGTIRLLMIFQVSFFSIDSNNIGFQSSNHSFSAACSRISLHDHGCWKQMLFEKTTN